jgi:hypothetical protein
MTENCAPILIIEDSDEDYEAADYWLTTVTLPPTSA